MPLTPAHIGPVILIGAISGRKLNLTVLITSTILIDLEHVYLGIRYGDIVHHGFWHTFGGATLYGLLYGTLFFVLLIMFWTIRDYRFRHFKSFAKIRESRKHSWTYSYKCVLMSAIIGAYTHISLDWLLYDNIRVLAISYTNIYYYFCSQIFSATFLTVYLFCLISFMMGLFIYLYRSETGKNRWYKISSIYDLKLHKKDIWTGLGIISTPYAISGIVIYLAVIWSLIFNPDNVPNTFNLLNTNIGVLIVSIVTICTMIIGYFKSLKNVNWKLFE